ncbi:MAG: PEP-CTERM sorting domain-containing protein [Phycisphaerae bacterium]|nr:PEP-CTERM sorting domain-containing protein [Phycisphaerae bacterium]
MKKLELCIVFLLITLMAIGASAATLTEGGNFAWDYGAVGDWDDGDGQNWRDSNPSTGTIIEEPDADSVALAGNPIWIDGPDSVCTVDTVVGGWSQITTPGTKIIVSGGATMNVVDGADLTGFGSIRVGDIRISPNAAYLNQTGGRIFLTRQADFGTLGIGDASKNPGGGMLPGAAYTISGGTLTYDADNSSIGHLVLGARNGYGQMTIVGAAPVINMKNLYIAGDYDSTAGAPYNYGTGILEYQIGADGVSPIVLNGTAHIDLGDADADGQRLGETTTADLILTLTAAPPLGDILLIDCTTTIQGTFDTVTGDMNGGKAEQGDRIKLTWGGNDYYYNLTYAGGTDGMDLVLVIPEPATLLLLAFGALTLRKFQRKMA